MMMMIRLLLMLLLPKRFDGWSIRLRRERSVGCYLRTAFYLAVDLTSERAQLLLLLLFLQLFVLEWTLWVCRFLLLLQFFNINCTRFGWSNTRSSSFWAALSVTGQFRAVCVSFCSFSFFQGHPKDITLTNTHSHLPTVLSFFLSQAGQLIVAAAAAHLLPFSSTKIKNCCEHSHSNAIICF